METSHEQREEFWKEQLTPEVIEKLCANSSLFKKAVENGLDILISLLAKTTPQAQQNMVELIRNISKG